MAMAGCTHCGRIESVVGHVEPAAGRLYKPCPECGRALRWMPASEAIALDRGHHVADLNPPSAYWPGGSLEARGQIE
jgi:hypothetical protein